MSVPIELASDVQEILGLTARSMRWRDQPAIDGHAQSVIQLSSRGRALSQLASRLAKLSQIHFDLESWNPASGGERYLFVPGLGIKRFELDAAGEFLVRSGSIELAIQESAGSQLELRRRLDILLARPWLALLEPLQAAPESPRLSFLVARRS